MFDYLNDKNNKFTIKFKKIPKLIYEIKINIYDKLIFNMA